MRNLFLALVLANLGFAAWHAWWGTPRAAPAQRAAPEASGITLVKELDGDGGGGEKGAGSEKGSGSEKGAVSEKPVAGDVLDTAQTSSDTQIPASAQDPAAAAVPKEAEARPRQVVATANEAAASLSQPTEAAASLSQPTPRRSGAAGDSPDGAARCVSVGPFLDLAQATTASATLRASGYEPSQRAGEGDVWVGYWVYLDAIPSRDEANRILTVLHDNGVADAYGIQGDDGRIISLGVFNQIARAGRLRDEVRALGFEPKVVDRTRREDVYFIDLMLSPSRQVDFEALQTPGRITRLEQRPCPGAGA